jgi:broad specificity phosphatase PhoE
MISTLSRSSSAFRSRTLFSAIVGLALLLALVGFARADDAQLTGPALVDALRQGGYVLVFRHAATDFSQRDEGRSKLDDCSTQRNLTEAGRADARQIGAQIRALHIPIGPVYASPFCRTRETAQLAFTKASLDRDLLWPGAGAEASVMAKHRAAVDTRFGTPPKAGENTVVVTHGFVIGAATQLNVEEGEALVVRPAGGRNFTVVARVKPAEWAGLAKPPAK